MSVIQGTFTVGGIPRNNATTKLWSAGSFASPPAKNDALPSGSPVASGLTSGSHGHDGAYRFSGVSVGEYYVSLEWNGAIIYDYHARNINPVVSIADFGASTGSSDNTAAISNAIAAASASGASVYVPPGTWIIAPSGLTNYIALKSNVTIFGEGDDSILKVQDNAPRYEFIFAASPSGATVNNVGLKRLQVNQNGANATGTVSDVAGRRARGFALFAGDNITIDDVTWKDISGINTCLFNGTTISRVRVTNNRFNWNPIGGTSTYDNTAVYINGRGSVVANNMFLAEPSGNARGAIQVTNGVSTINGNICNGYRKIVDVVSVTSPGRPASDISIIGNTASRALSPIQLWAVAGSELSNVNIANNTLQVSHVDHAQTETNGITLINDATITGTYRNITIHGNSIVFQQTPASGMTLTDNSCAGISAAPRGLLENIIITNNLISGAPVRGIRLGNTSGPISVSGALIAYNQLINCGYNIGSVQARRTAIGIESLCSDVKVRMNQILDTSGTFGGYASITADSSASSTYARTEIRDNYFNVQCPSGDFRFSVPLTKGLLFGEGMLDRAPTPLTDHVRYRFIDSWPATSGSYDPGDYIYVRDSVNASGSMRQFKVVSGGTFGSITISGSTTSASTSITLNDATGLKSGDYITIAGVTGVKRLISIGASGNAEISSSASASVTNAQIGYFTPTYEMTLPHESFKAAAPTAGTWLVGDRVWNNAPAGGGVPGWVCTASGTPGTWKTMAVLGA
jgi:hypothetical protein